MITGTPCCGRSTLLSVFERS